jgi:hypothetical protein
MYHIFPKKVSGMLQARHKNHLLPPIQTATSSAATEETLQTFSFAQLFLQVEYAA